MLTTIIFFAIDQYFCVVVYSFWQESKLEFQKAKDIDSSKELNLEGESDNEKP
jgi:hypothetical protein